MMSLIQLLLLKKVFKNLRIRNMSQTPITSYFKKNGEKKRKLDEMLDVKTSDQSAEMPEIYSPSSVRKAIINLARKNPAVSSFIGLSWFKALEKEFSAEYFQKIGVFLANERMRYTVYPNEDFVYSWTTAGPIEDVKVVILGQDPYHGPNQAHGLAFSVLKTVPCPPSLINIYKELENDIPDFKKPGHGHLRGWALQGVLLLNTCLTVRAGMPNSHRNIEKNGGWERFTDAVIRWIDQNLDNVVFMLWGANAKQKADFINKKKHLVLTAPHPSPLSARHGFFGCKHFSQTNEFLETHNKTPINWANLP